MWPYLSRITALHENRDLQNNETIEQLLLLWGKRIFIGTRPGVCKGLIFRITVRCNSGLSFNFIPSSSTNCINRLIIFKNENVQNYQQCLLQDWHEARDDSILPTFIFTFTLRLTFTHTTAMEATHTQNLDINLQSPCPQEGGKDPRYKIHFELLFESLREQCVRSWQITKRNFRISFQKTVLNTSKAFFPSYTVFCCYFFKEAVY